MQSNRVGLLLVKVGCGFLRLATLACALGLVVGCGSGSMHSGAGGSKGGAGGSGGLDGGVIDAPDASADTDGSTLPACTGSDSASRASGERCGCDSQCASGFCTDGVCCDTRCDGTCMACDLSASPGICSLVPDGVKPSNVSECQKQDPSTCGRDGTCDGKGGCRLYTDGIVCKGGTCDNGSVVGSSVCDGSGSCGAGPVQVCYPYNCGDGKCLEKCATQADCAPGGTCQGNSCGKRPPGGKCSVADDCDSGFCADGFCCNVACDDACLTCGAPGFEGQCRPLGTGMTHPKCPTTDRSTCGETGVCDGFGSCALFVQGVTCVLPSCTGNVLNTPGSCDGKGSCLQPVQQPCEPYVCRSGACATRCDSDMDCAPNRTCNPTTHQCGTRPMGAVCTDANQCDSGFCVDGFCCENACSGDCRSCGTAGGMPGRCRNVGAGSDDPHKQCKDGGSASCGTNGKCDGNGACQKYATGAQCSGESCSSGNYTPPSTCDASGKCMPQNGWKCSPFTCNGSKCATTCQDDKLCDTGNNNFCVNGSCGLKPPGSPCSSPTQCQKAPDGKQYCSQGYCCNGACTGGCQSCANSSSRGTCTNIPAGQNPQTSSMCPTSSNACGNTGKCNGSGGCQTPANGSTCNDSNACTRTDTCQNGNCTGSNPVSCVATDQCHSAGTCDTKTGACSNPSKADATACNDNNGCTSGETCQGGTCKGGTTKTCTASDQCHNAGTCDSATGNCSNPNKADGTTCSDGSSCTSGDTCQMGSCKPASTKTCMASDQCHNAGTCDPATGDCSNPNKADGTQCNSDDNACTVDSCQMGICKSGSAKTCTATDQCHNAGTCDPATGNCSNPAKADGADCNNDNNACTVDSCQMGICKSGSAKTCTATDQCHNAGTCDKVTGNCSNPAKTDGVECNKDNNACTVDSCQMGVCESGSPKTCNASDPCHSAGTCDKMTGNCSNPVIPDVDCNRDGCTGDTCSAGMCVPAMCGGGGGGSGDPNPTSAGGGAP